MINFVAAIMLVIVAMYTGLLFEILLLVLVLDSLNKDK